MTILISILAGVLLGGAGVFFYTRLQKDVLQKENIRLAQAVDSLQHNQETAALLTAENARLQAQNEALAKERQLVEKNFAEIAATYRAQFNDLATKILEEKSKGLEGKNTELLRPLMNQLEGFVKKVHDMERLTTEKHARLEKGLSDVIKSTEKIDQTAIELATAIKGESIIRGSWGEEALKRLLDSAGMKEGVDYFEQVSEEGKRVDIQLALPGDRWLVLDAKTIFNHYLAYYNEQDPQKKEEHLKAHVKDIQKTIEQLSSKKYYKKFKDTGEKIQPDYTLMFVYPESALLSAVSKEPDLLNQAWQQNVALVSATSLISTLKMVSKLWDIDKQHEYMEELKEDILKLMEKFNDFLVNFAKAESAVGTAFEAMRIARVHIDKNNGSFLPVAQRIVNVYEAPMTKRNVRTLKSMDYAYDGHKKYLSADGEVDSPSDNVLPPPPNLPNG